MLVLLRGRIVISKKNHNILSTRKICGWVLSCYGVAPKVLKKIVCAGVMAEYRTALLFSAILLIFEI